MGASCVRCVWTTFPKPAWVPEWPETIPDPTLEQIEAGWQSGALSGLFYLSVVMPGLYPLAIPAAIDRVRRTYVDLVPVLRLVSARPRLR